MVAVSICIGRFGGNQITDQEQKHTPVQFVILMLILVWIWYGFRMIILNSTI